MKLQPAHLFKGAGLGTVNEVLTRSTASVGIGIPLLRPPVGLADVTGDAGEENVVEIGLPVLGPIESLGEFFGAAHFFESRKALFDIVGEVLQIGIAGLLIPIRSFFWSTGLGRRGGAIDRGGQLAVDIGG